jgi:tyrosinase
MGSNGVYIPHGNGSSDWHSYGTGGGCVFSGPFTNMIVNLGPVGLHNTTGLPPVYPNAGLFDYNPRCLKRDVNPSQSQAWTTYERTLDLIVNYTDIEIFQARMQSDPRYYNTTVFTGVHSGGHNTISGDPGGVSRPALFSTSSIFANSRLSLTGPLRVSR